MFVEGGCGKNDSGTENVSTMDFINYNCSYGDKFAVFVEHDDTYGVDKIKYYNSQNNSYTYTCNSEFKSYADYTEWLSTEKNSYSKGIDIFNQKCEYYSIDLDTNKLSKLKFNYECTYEGINKEKTKEFCDFFILGKEGDYYYLSLQYGAGYSLYQYNVKTENMKEIRNSYRMYFCQTKEKLYWVETDYDENKQLGGFDSEYYSVEPRYKKCDMITGKITDWKINYDLKGDTYEFIWKSRIQTSRITILLYQR